MNTKRFAQIAGILMLGVFLISLYLGLYDTNLRTLNSAHYYGNWVIAVVSLVAAIVLIVKPGNVGLVVLSGVAWPIVYVLSLGVDVYTKLCLGAPASSCWPSKTVALDYLILNEASIPKANGYQWMLAPVMPVAIALLALVFILSLVAAVMLRRHAMPPAAPAQQTPAPTK